MPAMIIDNKRREQEATSISYESELAGDEDMRRRR